MENKHKKDAVKNDVSKKQAEGRKEWSKEWALEKETEGLDKGVDNDKAKAAESKKKTAECGCKYF